MIWNTMSKITSLTSLLNQFSLLLKGVRKQSGVSLLILIFQGITEGVGLLFIIPLLAIVGVGNTKGVEVESIHWLQSVFEQVNIPLNLSAILVSYLIIMIFYALLKLVQSINTALINQGVVLYWRNSFFERLTYASWPSINSIKNSDLQNIVNIEIRKFSAISNQLIHLTGTFILILVYLGVSLSISVKLTIMAIIPIGVLLFLNRPINRRTHQLGKTSVDFNRSIQSIIVEHLNAIKLVKSYRKEAEHIQEFKKTNSELEHQTVSYVKANSLTKFLFEILAAIIIAVYIYLAIVIFKTDTTELLLLIFIFVRLLPRTTKLANSYQQILNLLPAIDLTLNFMTRLKKATEVKRSNTFPNVSFNDSITFKEVNFSYESRTILQQVSFIIKANQTNVIIGPSGSGKSTCIDLMMGFQTPTTGKILIDSIPIQEIDIHSWQSKIGFVPQDPFLFHNSIEENLRWSSPNATQEELVNAIELAGAKSLIDKLPEGLNTIVGDRGTQLSGGERQRIALARALICKPEILILDEATSAVDNETEELILEALKKLHGSMTIIIVAHRSKLIELADQTIQLT